MPDNEMSSQRITIQRFTTEPVMVEAVHLTDDADWEAIAAWCGAPPHPHRPGDLKDQIAVPTPDGIDWAGVGDYVTRGAGGEHRPVKANVFTATFLPAGSVRTSRRFAVAVVADDQIIDLHEKVHVEPPRAGRDFDPTYNLTGGAHREVVELVRLGAPQQPDAAAGGPQPVSAALLRAAIERGLCGGGEEQTTVHVTHPEVAERVAGEIEALLVTASSSPMVSRHATGGNPHGVIAQRAAEAASVLADALDHLCAVIHRDVNPESESSFEHDDPAMSEALDQLAALAEKCSHALDHPAVLDVLAENTPKSATPELRAVDDGTELIGRAVPFPPDEIPEALVNTIDRGLAAGYRARGMPYRRYRSVTVRVAKELLPALNSLAMAVPRCTACCCDPKRCGAEPGHTNPEYCAAQGCATCTTGCPLDGPCEPCDRAAERRRHEQALRDIVHLADQLLGRERT